MPQSLEAADAPRLAFPFTERDTPESRARIEADLARVCTAVQEADPKLDALILTGGFSRGEGTVRGGRPVNDYDLIAVRRATGGDALYQRLSHELSAEVGIEVDLLPVARARLPLVGKKLFWLDARLGGRVLVGDDETLARIPEFAPGEVAPMEAARLLANRAAGLLLALPTPEDPQPPEQCDLQATKAALAAMDATLLSQSRYAPRMRERLALLRAHPDHDVFARAVAWKLAGAAEPMGEAWWREARDALLRAVEATGARRVGDGLPEHALAALKGRVGMHPSRAVRHAAWDLLAVSDYPDGPLDLEVAQRAVARLDGGDAHARWPELKRRFFAARARTLQ